jgi:hypothetical protein
VITIQLTEPSQRGRRERRRTVFAALLVAVAVALCLAAAFGPAYWRYASYAPREGDVIFQSLPRGALVNAIEGATHSPWSHCGIVARDQRGQWIVYEALNGVEATPLRSFLMRSRGDRYAIYRWREALQAKVPAMLDEVRAMVGRPYDIRYRMDDEKIYCSELIYKACRSATGQAPGKLVALGELDWGEYVALIERLEGGPVPVDRAMITPRDLAAAWQLELVRESP